jgi:NAD+ kinase
MRFILGITVLIKNHNQIKMKKIGIIFNEKRKPETKGPAGEITGWIKKRKCQVYINPSDAVLAKGLDFALVIGGDGTILRTADRIARFSIPLVGVNFGHRGYLCDIEESEIYSKLEKILQGKYKKEERTRIFAEVENKGKIVKEIDGLNEILIGGISRTVFLGLEMADYDKHFTANITGDGVLFATKTGSTGYNINAGGSILFADLFSVVANNAYFESKVLLPNVKSFITSTNAIFKIKILNDFKENLPFLAADGQRSYRLKKGDEIKVKKSKYKTIFLKVN